MTRSGQVFRVRLPVRWSDLDAQGHVNNALFFDYLQDARLDFLVAGGVTEMARSGVLAVSHAMEYRAPLNYTGEPVDVEIVLRERRHARFQVGYGIFQGDQLCALAGSTMVPFDLVTQRPRRFAPDEAEWFDRFRWDIVSPLRELPRPALQGRGHRFAVQTRWSDIDRQNHVNNVRVLDYFQEARIVMTTEADPSAARAGTAGDPTGRSRWVIARQDIDYLHQIAFRRTPYEVHTAIARVGTSSISLVCELWDPEGGQVLSRAAQVLVRADEHGRSQPIGDDLRAALAAYVL